MEPEEKLSKFIDKQVKSDPKFKREMQDAAISGIVAAIGAALKLFFGKK